MLGAAYHLFLHAVRIAVGDTINLTYDPANGVIKMWMRE